MVTTQLKVLHIFLSLIPRNYIYICWSWFDASYRRKCRCGNVSFWTISALSAVQAVIGRSDLQACMTLAVASLFHLEFNEDLRMLCIQKLWRFRIITMFLKSLYIFRTMYMEHTYMTHIPDLINTHQVYLLYTF